VVDLASSSTVESLQHLHETLDAHFTSLHASREALEPSSPVFALEHDLSSEDLDLLKTTVRAAVKAGLGARHRQWWLPFVVYAAESGYDYVGDEYWRTFEQSTRGWRNDQRSWIKTWFQRFAAEHGGAVPTGAFARYFKIIAWPITHAVLPTYLQRQLAQLMFEFSGALTSELLDDPRPSASAWPVERRTIPSGSASSARTQRSSARLPSRCFPVRTSRRPIRPTNSSS
jgi:hypothetical protein